MTGLTLTADERELVERLRAVDAANAKQLTRADLKTMTAEAISAAHRAGHLDHLLKGEQPDDETHEPPPAEPAAGNPDLGVRSEDANLRRGGNPTREDLKHMTPEAISRAHKEGRLDGLLKGEA